MSVLGINRSFSPPNLDGEINKYSTTFALRQGIPTRYCMYIPGIGMSPKTNMAQSEWMATFIEGFAINVHNRQGEFRGRSIREWTDHWQSADPFLGATVAPGILVRDAMIPVFTIVMTVLGLGQDVTQSTRDWLPLFFAELARYLSGPSIGSARGYPPPPFAPAIMAALHREFMFKVSNMIDGYFYYNPAIQSMFRFLNDEVASWPGGRVSIVAHSQGCLIASDALYGYKALCRAYSRSFPELPITVYALGSPAPSWPPEILRHNYAHGIDYFTWFSGPTQSHWPTRGPGGSQDRGEIVRASGKETKAFKSLDHDFTLYTAATSNKQGSADNPDASQLASFRDNAFVRDIRLDMGLPETPIV